VTPVIVLGVMFLLAFAAALAAAGLMWVVQPSAAKFGGAEADPAVVDSEAGADALMKDEDLSTIGFWSELLKGISHVETLRRWLEEAGLEWSVGRVTLFMMLSGSAVYAVLWQFAMLSSGVSLLAAIIAASIPLALIRSVRQRRFRQFSEQFPEALDSLTRALKAGYPLSSAVDLLAMEQPEPIAGEMRKLRDQWKLGVGWDQALDDLSTRVPLPEVSMFVAAVKMQNRVGGRLNDVLARLGESMRDNQVFESEVRSIAAHSRITGSILTVLPIAIGIMLYIVNPEYVQTLFRREEGRLMLLGVVIANIAAHFLIRKLTQVRI